MPTIPPPNSPPQAFGGTPGASWANDTGKILYQLHVQFSNSCARCIQWSNCIGPWWPTPFHPSCNCVNVPIPPGQSAAPFHDFEAEMQKLGPHGQRRAMGASNWKLVRSGTVQWEDVVTRGRIRPLEEVVHRGKLTVGQLQAAGISKARAEQALKATLATAPAEAARAAALAKLKALGLSDAQIRDALKARLKARLGIKGTAPPAGPTDFGPAGPNPTPTPPPAPFSTPHKVAPPRRPKPPRVEKVFIPQESMAPKFPQGPFGKFFLKGDYPHTPDGLAKAKADWSAKLSAGSKKAHAAKKAAKVKAHAEAFPDSADGLKSVRSLGGHSGTNATLVEDADGRQFVMKSGGSAKAAQLREEFHAEQAYRALGVPVPESRLYETAGGPVKLSAYVDGVTLGSLLRSDPAAAGRAMAKVREHFAVDALMASWDVVGADYDNILVAADGTPLRIDLGGSLRFRAQGAPKGGAFGHVVSELESLKNAQRNPTSAKVFGPLTDDEVKAQVGALLAKKDALLAALPADPDLRATIAARLKNFDEYLNPPPDWTNGWKSFTKLGRAVGDLSAARDWAKQHWDGWVGAVASGERQALGYYKGSGYTTINDELRSGPASRPTAHRVTELDKAINKAHVPEDIVVWRGVRDRVASKFHDPANQIGEEVTDKGFVSVSTNKEVSQHGFYRKSTGAMLRVKVPKGTPAGYLDGLTGSWGGEYELLLHRETKFRIVGVGTYDDGGMLIDCELVVSPHARPKP